MFETISEALKSPRMPSFPVSRTVKLDVPFFKNVWVKDESTNETGTHKDRMAWEIVMVYWDILTTKSESDDTSELPRFSIISAGSAALAIQTQLRKYKLPNLKVLVDSHIDHGVLSALGSLGCEIYQEDLGERQLTSKDILELTNNETGFDITSNKGFDPTLRFYDWLAYEVLNENADYVFTPFGTGQLYENIINIAKNIIASEHADKVYTGDKTKIKKMNFMGATTSNPDTRADKLYAPFKPFTTTSKDWVTLLSKRGYCGDKSGVYEVTEENIVLGYELLGNNKINTEYSGAAALGLLYQMKDQVPRENKILIVNTGKTKLNN